MLFTPFKIGKMEVKNRLVMSPMGTNSAFTNGRKDAQEIDYFIERAKGGVGMIIMGCQPLNEEIAQGSMEGYMDSFSVLPALTSVCDGVHRYGAKIVCQLSCGTGRNAFPDTFGNPPMSASAIPSVFNPDVPCRAMTKEDIQKVMDGFAFAAGAARDVDTMRWRFTPMPDIWWISSCLRYGISGRMSTVEARRIARGFQERSFVPSEAQWGRICRFCSVFPWIID